MSRSRANWPTSMWRNPSCSDTSLAMVVLPTPGVPVMSMLGRLDRQAILDERPGGVDDGASPIGGIVVLFGGCCLWRCSGWFGFDWRNVSCAKHSTQ